MDESQGFDKQARADRAKDILDLPVFQDAMQAVRDSIFRSWESLPVDAVDQLRNLKLSIHILNAIERNLRAFIEEGELEKFDTEYQDKLKESNKWQT